MSITLEKIGSEMELIVQWYGIQINRFSDVQSMFAN